MAIRCKWAVVMAYAMVTVYGIRYRVSRWCRVRRLPSVKVPPSKMELEAGEWYRRRGGKVVVYNPIECLKIHLARKKYENTASEALAHMARLLPYQVKDDIPCS